MTALSPHLYVRICTGVILMPAWLTLRMEVIFSQISVTLPVIKNLFFSFKAISLTLVVATKLIYIFKFIFFDLRERVVAILSKIKL
jgi:hypothetical protein